MVSSFYVCIQQLKVMKKLICFLLSTCSFLFLKAQDTEVKYNCYIVQTGVYNERTGRIDYDEKRDADFGVTLCELPTHSKADGMGFKRTIK